MIKQIPIEEFDSRIKRIKDIMLKRKIDLLIVFGSECEPQNLIYLSNYWPAFETACVLIPLIGDPVLVIGPESLSYAKDSSVIKNIYQVLEHRESAEPNYPDADLQNYQEIIKLLVGEPSSKKIALCGFSIINLPVYKMLEDVIGGENIINGDDILKNIRLVKSENETSLMKKASEITMKSFETLLENIKPGMEEVEVVSLVSSEMFKNKAENYSYTPYILSGKRSRLAIGRASHKIISKNEPLQFDCGCKFGNYSSSLGRSFCIGKMSDEYKKFINMGIELQKIVLDKLKAGINAGNVFRSYWDHLEKKNFSKYFLYGPCHGTGIMECEHPFLEADSNYVIQDGMTYQVDIFLVNPDFGVRFENGVVVRKDGVEEFSSKYRNVIEL